VEECKKVFCFGAMFARGQNLSQNAADHCCEAEYSKAPWALPVGLHFQDITDGVTMDALLNNFVNNISTCIICDTNITMAWIFGTQTNLHGWFGDVLDFKIVGAYCNTPLQQVRINER